MTRVRKGREIVTVTEITEENDVGKEGLETSYLGILLTSLNQLQKN